MSNEFLNKKTAKENTEKKKDSNKRKCAFEIDEGRVKIIKIENYDSFQKEVAKISNPCAISNFKDVISNCLEEDENNNIIDVIDFDKKKSKNIITLSSKENIKKFFCEKKKSIFPFVFSSPTQYEIIQRKLLNEKNFMKIHSFDNYMSKKCRIYAFCLDENYHFPKNSIPFFYNIDRDLTRPWRIFYYHKSDDDPYLASVVKFFGPTGTGKSLIVRMVFHNYSQFDGDFTPFCFFNVKLLNNLYDNNKLEEIKRIINNECFSLFKEIKLWEEFTEKINNIFYNNIMELIQDIIKEYITSYKLNYPVFILDNYSYEYDNKIIANELQKECFTKKNFNLYIIYDIKCEKDQEEFINLYQPNKPLFYSYNISKEKVFFHKNNLKSFKIIKKYLKEDEIDIPNNYETYFGDNSSYFFLFYLNREQDFIKFIEEQKQNIINDLKDFYSSTISKEKLIDIYEYINKKNVDYNYNLFKLLPGKYINFTKEMSPNQKFKYTIDFSFPLVKASFEELIDRQFFINVRSKEFMDLEPIPMGVNFDLYMNDWIKNRKKIFNYNEDEIVFIKDEDILEKNKFDITGRQMFKKEDVIKTIKSNFKLINLRKECLSKNLNNKKLILVLQKFQGKTVDFLMIAYNDKISKFILNSIQVKLSDTYKITKEEKKRLPFEIEYIREKYAYILNIDIENKYSYFTFLSLYELKKKFAEKNMNKCIFYSRDNDILVNNEGKELLEFPMMDGALITFKKDFIYSYECFLSSRYDAPFILKEKKQNNLKLSYKLEKNEALIIYKGSDVIFKCKMYDNKILQIKEINNFKKDNIIKLFEVIDNFPKY